MITGKDKKAVEILRHEYHTMICTNISLTYEVADLTETVDKLRDYIEELKHDIADLEENVADMREEARFWKDRCDKYALDEHALKEELEMEREEHGHKQYDYYPDFTCADTDGTYIAKQLDKEISLQEKAYIQNDIDLINEIMRESETPEEMFDEALIESGYKILDTNYADKYEKAREIFLMVKDKKAQSKGLHAVLDRILKDNCY